MTGHAAAPVYRLWVTRPDLRVWLTAPTYAEIAGQLADMLKIQPDRIIDYGIEQSDDLPNQCWIEFRMRRD